MRKFSLIAAATLTALAGATASFAGNGDTRYMTPATSGITLQKAPVRDYSKYKLSYGLTCRVQGTPVEFPDDVTIWNTSSYTVPAGTKVKWQVAGAWNGVATLPQIAPGGSAFLSGVLGGGTQAGENCFVTQL